MKIFILVGFQLTGKSSHGHKMEIEENVPMIETGHAVYYDLQRQGLETNHVNTSKVIKDLLSRDPTAFAQAILEFEEKKYKDSSIMLFNGIKSPANEIIITENIQWPYYGFELSYKDFKNYIFYKKN